VPKPSRWETIVRFGYEGGGVTVAGRTRPDGTWELRYSSTSMTLDENDDEKWIGSTRSLGSLAEAFDGYRRDFGAMRPVEPVHPAFRDEMLAIVEDLAPRPGDPAYEWWQRFNRERWLNACAPTNSDDPVRP
jgi:hypothetical protein